MELALDLPAMTDLNYSTNPLVLAEPVEAGRSLPRWFTPAIDLWPSCVGN